MRHTSVLMISTYILGMLVASLFWRIYSDGQSVSNVNRCMAVMQTAGQNMIDAAGPGKFGRP